MDAVTPSAATLPSPQRWSLLAGVYAFGCAVLTAYLLSDVLGLFAEVVGLPSTLSMVALASPALVAGPGIWWAIVERSETYAYRRGAAFGLLTALVTGGLWTGRFAVAWGVEMFAAGPVRLLVGFVLGTTAAVGVLVGLPFTYVRRRSQRRSDRASTANSL